MSQAPVATNREIKLNTDEFIVSKTDLNSNILYINRVFMQISGFSEIELINKPHNMIRHPEMPKGVFRLFWNEISAGNEFLGYVKNLCKDGSYYWVFAHVTPDRDIDGNVTGYYSARRAPTRKAVETMDNIYKEMLKIEKTHPHDKSCSASLAFLEETISKMGLSYFQLVQQLDTSEG